MKKLTLILLLLSFTYTELSVAQTCHPAVTADAPNSRYIVNANGTALDKKTGLIWMRCVLGQTWGGGNCIGAGASQNYDWQTALQTAESTVFAGKSDWRLPNQNELQSLVENRCYSPAINLIVFPNAQSDFVWSSSSAVGYSYDAWIVDFYYGRNSNSYKGKSYSVRLVRGGQ
jgi:Protein of unknown function (DUF1566)